MSNRSLAQRLRRFAVLGAFACLAPMFLLSACQRSMIYHPTRYPAGSLDKVAAGLKLGPWLNASGKRIGWRHSAPAARKQVLVVHGNAGSAIDRSDFVEGLQSAGPANVFILEYPGYGERAGSPTQKSLLHAAKEGLELLTNNGPVYVVGESLGTGVAASIAGTFPHAVNGLLLFCPYNNFTDVAKHHMPILPVSLILRDRFPSDDWLRNYQGPVGILVASQDTIVPARLGRQLYDGYHGPKKFWEIPNAGHNDVFNRPKEWWQEVFQFWGAEK